MPGLVLVIEDEVELADTIRYNLEQAGYQVSVAHTGKIGLAVAMLSPIPDVIVLDLMLPDITGVDVCRRLREHDATRDVMILMCTARSEEIDRIVGFEVGADDYLVKPFSMRELVLRVRALLRRMGADRDGTMVVEAGPIKMDCEAHRVWINKTEVVLTALEFKLLLAFVRRPGRMLSRDTLLQEVWEVQGGVTTRTVDTHIKRLREKLGDAGEYIETLRGSGYRFRE